MQVEVLQLLYKDRHLISDCWKESQNWINQTYHALTDTSSSDIVSAFAFESAQQPTTTSTPLTRELLPQMSLFYFLAFRLTGKTPNEKQWTFFLILVS